MRVKTNVFIDSIELEVRGCVVPGEPETATHPGSQPTVEIWVAHIADSRLAIDLACLVKSDRDAIHAAMIQRAEELTELAEESRIQDMLEGRC